MPRKSSRTASRRTTTAVVAAPPTQLVPLYPPAAPAYAVPPAKGNVVLPERGGSPMPPLPETIEVDAPDDAFGAADTAAAVAPTAKRPLRPGSYLMRYAPPASQASAAGTHYDGTFRVDRNVSVITASGDLYLHKTTPWPGAGIAPGEPNPATGIPIFPRAKYTYYLRVNSVTEAALALNRVTIGFNLFRFSQSSQTWNDLGVHTASMRWMPPPAGFPANRDYLTGSVKSPNGGNAGTLSLVWLSTYLRRATIEIDRCAPCEWPLENGAGVGWQQIFDLAGWQVDIRQSNSDVAEPSGESWSDAEMHSAMLTRRDSSDLDREWRYHILCVRRIDSTPRGIMYDSSATDSNNVPREGVGIASHWIVPDEEEWGLVRNVRFGTAAGPYFRTAVHELGHAMGLYHNTMDLGIMNTTDVIAASAVGTPTPFPNNIQWSHASDDQMRLRHLPDVHVRPGGLPFGDPYGPDELDDAAGIDITVTPIVPAFPLGAPVRVEFSLTNSAYVPLPVPASLSMKSGHVKGYVIDPSGNAHPFLPMLLCLEERELKTLAPGEKTGDSLTLLRGPRGSLFPASGAYRVIVEVTWDAGGYAVTKRGETPVMVTPAMNDSHAEAALKVLSTPDALVALVVGGDHMTEGIAAIHAALGDATLRPHFAAIEAKRVGRRFMSRAPNYKAAADLLDEHVVATRGELDKLATIASGAPATYRTQMRASARRRGDAGNADTLA